MAKGYWINQSDVTDEAGHAGLASSSQRLPPLPSCSNRSRSGTTRRSNGGSVPQRLSYSLATRRGPTGAVWRPSWFASAARPLLTPSRDKSARRRRLHEVPALAASLASANCFCTPSRRYSSGSSRSNADTAPPASPSASTPAAASSQWRPLPGLAHKQTIAGSEQPPLSARSRPPRPVPVQIPRRRSSHDARSATYIKTARHRVAAGQASGLKSHR